MTTMDAVSATIDNGGQAICQYRLVWATAKSVATSYILYFEN
jgi:hypothetical protein